VAWGVFEGNLHDLFLTQAEAQEMAELKGSHAKVRPLYTTPPKRPWVDEAAIRADERERIKAANEPEIERINAYLKNLEDAVEAEREACALICDDQARGAYWEGADACADAIRARGNT